MTIKVATKSSATSSKQEYLGEACLPDCASCRPWHQTCLIVCWCYRKTRKVNDHCHSKHGYRGDAPTRPGRRLANLLDSANQWGLWPSFSFGFSEHVHLPRNAHGLMNALCLRVFMRIATVYPRHVCCGIIRIKWGMATVLAASQLPTIPQANVYCKIVRSWALNYITTRCV